MVKRFVLLIISFICTFYYNDCHAQAQQADTIQQRVMAVNMEHFFNKAIGRQSRLYNGFAYQLVGINSPGNAYFNDTTSLVNGNVRYGGLSYRNVPLLYDIYNDVLVSRLMGGALLFSLVTEQVDDFDLFGHHFINLHAADVNNVISAGYYDELYNSNQIQLLAKRNKTFQQDIQGVRNGRISFSVLLNDRYYLKKDSLYYKISGSGKFLTLLGDKKKELRKYLKDNNIRYNDNPEQTMVLLTKYYDSLKK
ncbi:MAG: hypothetical protein V4553_06475 [Bacteroidota bacterium]